MEKEYFTTENKGVPLGFIVLSEVQKFINTIRSKDSGKIKTALEFLEARKTEALLIKQLKGKIVELSIKQYRVIFFEINSTIYVIDIFKKQSRKTPLRIIERAENIYKKINNIINEKNTNR
jgi:phage-related protein